MPMSGFACLEITIYRVSIFFANLIGVLRLSDVTIGTKKPPEKVAA